MRAAASSCRGIGIGRGQCPGGGEPAGAATVNVSAGIGPKAICVTSKRRNGSPSRCASARSSAPRSASKLRSKPSAPAPSRISIAPTCSGSTRGTPRASRAGRPAWLSLAERLESELADDADGVEEESVRGCGRPALLLDVARDRAPRGVPREPPLTVPDEEPSARLAPGGLLPETVGALVGERRRPRRLVGLLGIPRHGLRDGIPRPVPLAHVARERLARARCVASTRRRSTSPGAPCRSRRGRARAGRRGRPSTDRTSRMLVPPARGDRPATTRTRRWPISSPSF